MQKQSTQRSYEETYEQIMDKQSKINIKKLNQTLLKYI